MTSPQLITEDGQPVSHFSLSTVENEAREEAFTFEVDGEFFTMASPEDADWKVIEGISSPSGLQDYIRDLLGDDWDRFSAIRITGKQIAELLEACNSHYGTSAGKSKSSGRSSKPTRKR